MTTTVPHLLAAAGAGFVAGGANTIGGGGSLLSFPVLVATGLSPLQANVTNTVGLIPGSAGGAYGYRRELADQGLRIVRLTVPATIGAILGAVALLAAPPGVFENVVPYLIIASCLMLLAQPRVNAWLAARREEHHDAERSPGLYAGSLFAGWYGGYFGAAVGILWLGVLGLFLDDDTQRLNGLKNLLSALVNAVAAVGFAVFGPVHWVYALVLAVASLAGGAVAASFARRIPGQTLRIAVACIGIVVAIVLAVT